MGTAYDLIVGALQNCGAYAIGEPPNAAFGSMGLRMLNQLRAQWNAEGVACFGLRVGSTAATGAASYTIGTGADIGIDVHGVRAVTVTNGSGTTRELTRITFDEYMSLSDKTTAGEAQYYAFRQGAPAILYVYPAQSMGNILVTARGRFNPISNVSDTIPEPDEYLLTMEAALSVMMAPKFGKQLDPTVSSLAANGYAALRARANSDPPPIMDLGVDLRGTAYIDHMTEQRTF